MEANSSVGALGPEDLNRLNWLYTKSSICDGVSLNDLGNALTEIHIEDDHKVALSSNIHNFSGKDKSNRLKGADEHKEAHQTESTIVSSENCLSKHHSFSVSSDKETFPVPADGIHRKQEVHGEEEEEDLTASKLKGNSYELVKPGHRQPTLLPTSSKLVSAMKGSREKLGTPPKKLTVTWAPDVYDPPPSASTILRHKKPRSKSDSKKNGKSKQKGKPSKGCSSNKDKKQGRKHGGSNKCYQSLDYYDDVFDYAEPCAELGDFAAGSYCGSSFLKKSAVT
ncbi:uncharacterized protein LOC127790081 isoform X2 [Diospyros lotus]|uniref:uncharacterized protein LOC127790081 isoform X2 n=1 Tax=Diospyros lotus TaxID=55363 RepID=UPI002255A943|nr:uncharacterized protein LOC127790081 isoform X2 [Diospyros lotus]